ncbi:MAG: glucose-1-phosphate adenylyltransferase subunit GlgD [Ruminococcaceae bacterium]|nr:glucose-1-phosphate adenylyltransferase subunit GlgD [Oscillospiraceae bacterium]
MADGVAGIIFSSLNNNTLSRLTHDRTVAAIPFACRYRLVDFCLSNMVNADISNINIIVNYNYRSLLEHIGSGKDWDLARRAGGINVISPYQTAHSGNVKVFSNHMEALKNMKEYIDEFKEEYVIMTDSDYVLSINFNEIIKYHIKNEADITFVTKLVSPSFTSKTPKMMIMSVGGRITDISMNSSYNLNNPELSLNIFIMKTERLRKIIESANSYSQNSLTSVFLSSFKRENYRTYCYSGFVASVSSFLDYYRYSIELAKDENARASLLGQKDLPVFTRVYNSSPTLYKSDAVVRNSMLADECVIEGTVIDSMIFRGVHVEKGAVVKNSILFHGTRVGKDAEVNCIVTDKDVYITDGVKLSGNKNMPFYIQKNRKV